MKHPVLALALGAVSLAVFFTACENPASTNGGEPDAVLELATAPAAVAANDSSYLGVYKGVITDTAISGSFWVSITEETAGSVKAALNVLLTTAGGTSMQILNADPVKKADDSYDVTFSLTSNGVPFVMNYNVSATGVVSAPDLTASGEQIGINIAKETTTVTVESWEGTISGSSSGVTSGTSWTVSISGKWNFIRTGDEISGSWSTVAVNSLNGIPDDFKSGNMTGTISSNAITFGSGTPDTCTGTFSGSSVGGSWSWVDTTKGSGTWAGIKKQ